MKLKLEAADAAMRLAGVLRFDVWVPSRDGSVSVRAVVTCDGRDWEGTEQWSIWRAGLEGELDDAYQMTEGWKRHVCAMLGVRWREAGSTPISAPFGRLLAVCLYRATINGVWPGRG